MKRKRSLSLLLALVLAVSLSGIAAASEDVSETETVSSVTEETEEASETEATTETEETTGTVPEVTYDPTALSTTDPVPDATAQAVLLMDASTGTVLWEERAHEQLEPASVTKIMTMLLVCEALDAGTLALDQTVTVSAHAAGMGGSQVYLEEGEQMTVEELLKAVAVVSANDAAVALGETVAGSEAAFVERMNAKAAALGMEDTTFCNCTGLPADGHVTSAYDIALMSRALLEHDLIRDYTGIWMDSLRDGAFTLSSTNKLLRSYDGCTGLKTGYTSTAGYCISATAERDGMELIAVVLGADSSADRSATATALLDWGFASFRSVTVAPEQDLAPVPVALGVQDSVAVEPVETTLLICSADEGQISSYVALSDGVEAPVSRGDTLGSFVVLVGDQVAAVCPLTAAEGAERLRFGGVLGRYVKILLTGDG